MSALDLPSSIYQFYENLYFQIQSSSKANHSSLHIALTCAMMGASGETADQMSKGLCLGDADMEEIAVKYEKLLLSLNDQTRIANNVYVSIRNPIKPSFKELATKHFQSEVQELDFNKSANAAKIINEWVELKTNKHVQDLTSEKMFNKNTRMVLVNAIYFKGRWLKPFHENNTKKDSFFISEKQQVKVDIMNQIGYFPFAEIKNLDAKVIKLSYEENLSMVVVLPNERIGLKMLESKLKKYNISRLCDQIKSTQNVSLYLPKFKIEFEVKPLSELGKIGMAKMFTSDAEFGGLLVKPEVIFVNRVVHKAFIEVNEIGTIGAAATAALIVMCSANNSLTLFKADHPFKFFIQNDENVVLFAGSYHGP